MKPLLNGIGALLMSFICSTFYSCGGAERVIDTTALPLEKLTCDTEAQQLRESVFVYGSPKAGLTPITKLDAGHFVYRCEQRGEWLGVMFPSVGEKVDCSERSPDRVCTLGWIRSETRMEVFG